jgi:hypothetical protein
LRSLPQWCFLRDLFEYALQQKITERKNQSALVNIVQAPIAADRVTLWNSEDEQAVRALWITHTTGLTHKPARRPAAQI